MVDCEAQRVAMVEGQLRTSDVTDRRVLAAMRTIPRERFVPERLKAFAYIDRDLSLVEAGAGRPARSMMEPTAFAKLLQLAALSEGERALDVGSAGGYSAAVIGGLVGSAVALESDSALAESAREAFAALGIANVVQRIGPLEQGAPDAGPFDVIVLEGAVEEVPQALLDQLAEGGRLVAIVGYGRAARATLFERLSNGRIAGRPDFDRAVAPLPGFSKPPAFVF